MILIDRKKVKEAKNDIYYMGHVSSSAPEQIYLCNCASFDSGVAFAEKELQTLSIEYSEWLSIQKDYSFCKSKNVWTLYGKSGEFDLTSKQLFVKFIEQRTKA